jgi:hypothetical protein
MRFGFRIGRKATAPSQSAAGRRWAEARARYEQANADYLAALGPFNTAEDAVEEETKILDPTRCVWPSADRMAAFEASVARHNLRALSDAVDAKCEEERIALEALIATPAPDLHALVYKLQRIDDHGNDRTMLLTIRAELQVLADGGQL